MRIIIAPDSFKGSLSAAEAAAAMAAGWLAVRPGDEVNCIPMADGGEGTVDTLVYATHGAYVVKDVCGAMAEMVDAQYGFLGGDLQPKTAVIETASAAGMNLLPEGKRNPKIATTRGVGELVAHALSKGAERILVGLGGSGTNDGGAGLAQALGWRLLDAAGKELAPGGAALSQLARIENGGVLPALRECEVLAICDVDNPLCGARGASAVYGPQKGASPEDVPMLDAALAHFAEIIKRDLGADIKDMPGAGAAGGLGAGLVAFANAELRPGFEIIAQTVGLAEAMRGADIVLTGEGRIDAQTLNGKTPLGVARLAKECGVPRVYAFSGTLGDGYEAILKAGVDACFAINSPNYQNAKEELAQCVQEFAEKLKV